MPSPIRSVQLLTVYVNLRLNGSHVLMIANDCACVYVCPRKNLRIQIWKFLVLPVCFFGLETTLDIRLPPPPHDLYFCTCLPPLRVLFSLISCMYIACASRRPFLAVTHLKFIAKDQKKKKTKRIETKQQKNLLTKKTKFNIQRS